MPLEFPRSRNEWRLDVVSLLAVIGESSMSKHAQTLTASRLCLLPRLIPAPQALIRPARPSGLPSPPADVLGVRSGNFLTQLNHFADMIHPTAELKRYSLREISIEHRSVRHATRTVKKTKFKDISTKRLSFLNLLTVASSLLSVALLFWSVVHQDGAACLAILVISFTSSLLGLASLWQPRLTERVNQTDVPPGDMVVRTRNGAFVVVHCSEEVARELYVATEDCAYKLTTRPSQILVGTSTILLMVGVIMVGNCSFEMQVALGVSYITLNGLYWAAAILPPLSYWDLGVHYQWKEQRNHLYGGYTRTLYNAILASSRNSEGKIRDIKTSWVRTGRCAPETIVWNKWLDEVEQKGNTKIGDEEWDPVKCLDELQRQEDYERGIVRPGKGT